MARRERIVEIVKPDGADKKQDPFYEALKQVLTGFGEMGESCRPIHIVPPGCRRSFVTALLNLRDQSPSCSPLLVLCRTEDQSQEAELQGLKEALVQQRHAVFTKPSDVLTTVLEEATTPREPVEPLHDTIHSVLRGGYEGLLELRDRPEPEIHDLLANYSDSTKSKPDPNQANCGRRSFFC